MAVEIGQPGRIELAQGVRVNAPDRHLAFAAQIAAGRAAPKSRIVEAAMPGVGRKEKAELRIVHARAEEGEPGLGVSDMAVERRTSGGFDDAERRLSGAFEPCGGQRSQ